jgi:serine/threonine-protein kinase
VSNRFSVRRHPEAAMTDDALDDFVLRLEARVGLTLKGKWRLDRLLGVGGMASVYAATHRNNKRVAVKMLHPELSMNTAIRQRFQREGYVANSVGHPGAVSVDDDDVTDDGCAFLVMELLEGETVDARWERKGRLLEATEVLALVDQVLETLAAAHDNGIVHRDLKPENLFLTHGGQVKVLDFGIARVRELSASGSNTQTGSLMGTPTFMPPEQARGRWAEVDGASDIWAVGATMFTLLTGRFVHLSTTVNEALVLAVTQPAPSVGGVGVALPTEVVALVDRALAYEKVQRWPDARTMQEALRHAYSMLTNRPITLLEAFEEDQSGGIAARESPAVSAPRTATTADGVTATKFGPAGAGDARTRARMRVAAFAGAIVLLVVLVSVGLRSRSTAGAAPEPSSTGIPARVASAVENAPPKSEVNADHGSPPVVPIERLPLASAAPARASVGEQSRKALEMAHPLPTSASASPISSTHPIAISPKPAPPVGDPWAARH